MFPATRADEGAQELRSTRRTLYKFPVTRADEPPYNEAVEIAIPEPEGIGDVGHRH